MPIEGLHVIILYPKCQCHYPVPQVSVSLSCTPSVSAIILYPKCQCHYPVPQVVSAIVQYPKCQCHYPVPQVSVSLSCTPSVSAIILYPKCQCHYPVLQVSVPLSCTPSVSVIILYPKCQRHYPVPQTHSCFTLFLISVEHSDTASIGYRPIFAVLEFRYRIPILPAYRIPESEVPRIQTERSSQ
ncbi:unnamed protein product, partial [Ranitomeya imitator]